MGGVPGYHEFLESILTDPYSEEGQRMLEWVGGMFAPEIFDKRSANAAIQRMLWNHWGGK